MADREVMAFCKLLADSVWDGCEDSEGDQGKSRERKGEGCLSSAVALLWRVDRSDSICQKPEELL
jgi:hypothetical protein